MARAFLSIAAGACVLLEACTSPAATPTSRADVTTFHTVVPGAPATTPQPPAPSASAVWVPANYEWSGSAYALQPGHWSERVPSGQVWQPGHWLLGPSGSYVWVKGDWVNM